MWQFFYIVHLAAFALSESKATTPMITVYMCCPLLVFFSQLVGLGIGFLQLSHPATQAFTNTLQLWLVSL